MAQGVRGVVLGSALAAHEHLVPLVAKGLAAVSLDRACADDSLLRDFVSLDNHLAAAMAIAHLVALGHRHIAFVSAPVPSMNRLTRQERAQAACDRSGATLHVDTGTSDGDYTESEMAEMGRKAAPKVLKDPHPECTSIVGVNDMVAIGLLAGIRQAGIGIPREVSVVGFDGVFLANT